MFLLEQFIQIVHNRVWVRHLRVGIRRRGLCSSLLEINEESDAQSRECKAESLLIAQICEVDGVVIAAEELDNKPEDAVDEEVGAQGDAGYAAEAAACAEEYQHMRRRPSAL